MDQLGGVDCNKEIPPEAYFPRVTEQCPLNPRSQRRYPACRSFPVTVVVSAGQVYGSTVAGITEQQMFTVWGIFLVFSKPTCQTTLATAESKLTVLCKLFHLVSLWTESMWSCVWTLTVFGHVEISAGGISFSRAGSSFCCVATILVTPWHQVIKIRCKSLTWQVQE